MAIPFKLTSGAPANPEVQHTNFKEHYPEVNHSMAWDELQPYIEQAVDLYFLPYLGPIYDIVVDKYAASQSLNSKEQVFLKMLQRAAAYYTIVHALPKKLAVVASMGAVNNSPTGGAAPVSQWSFKNQLWSVIKDADTFRDKLLEFLQAEVDASNTTFDSWKSSPAYQEGKSDFFRSTKEFQGYHNIAGSPSTFLALIPYIQKAARKYILPILGREFYDELVSAFQEGNPSNPQKQLLYYLKPCLAEYAVYMAIPSLSCIIEGDGLKVISRTDGMDTRGNVGSTFGKEAIDRHQVAAEENARTFRIDLIEYLYRNEAHYPTWQSSDFRKNAQSSSSSVTGEGSPSVFI